MVGSEEAADREEVQLKMKLLVVMTCYPFPPKAGSSIIAYNNVKELSKKHSICFVCFDIPKERGDFAGFVEQTESVLRKKTPIPIKLFRYFFYMLQGIPFSVTACISHEMKVKVRDLIENNEFDAILLYEMKAIQYCPPSSYGKVIVNIEDPRSIRLSRMRNLPGCSLWKKTKLLVDEKLFECYESRIISKMARVLLLSEADAQDMKTQGAYVNLGSVPYGVKQRALIEIINYEGRADGMIVFSGNMFHSPNVDGILFFLRDILPLVLLRYPSAILWIVGADPNREIRDVAEKFGEHVFITGRVNDVSDYLKYAKVSVCPVRLRIGVQTKILEALSWGTPVVTTSAGNSGITGSPGSELWIEDDPVEFANRVVALLHGESWARLSEGGKRLVAKRFSWECSAAQLQAQIEHISTSV